MRNEQIPPVRALGGPYTDAGRSRARAGQSCGGARLRRPSRPLACDRRTETPIVDQLMAPQVHVLQFVKGKYAGQEYALEPNGAYIAGRSSEVDLVLADDAVSRKHARFFANRGRMWVRDLGSRNGTHVNGKPVERACIRDGDRVAIGSSLVKVATVESSQVSASWKGKRKPRPGEAAAAPTGRSMSGSIEDIPLVDVLQWLATSRKTGQLKVRAPTLNRAGSLHLRDGQVFYASIESSPDLPAQKALMRMLLWDKGSFELDSNVVEEPPNELQSSLEHLLMEAARQQDELANLAARTSLPDAEDRLILVQPSPVRWKELEEAELDFLQLAHEGEIWGAVLDLSETDDLATTWAAVALKNKGIVTWG